MGAAGEAAHRASARIIVLDQDGYVLLFQVDDPLDANPPAWVTPGGGVEPGETIVETACRELWEETGRRVAAAALGEIVAVSRGPWVFRGRSLFSEDFYFSYRTPRYQPGARAWTDLERQVTRGWRWWSAADLETTSETVFPAGLAELSRALHRGNAGPRTDVVVLPWTTF